MSNPVSCCQLSPPAGAWAFKPPVTLPGMHSCQGFSAYRLLQRDLVKALYLIAQLDFFFMILYNAPLRSCKWLAFIASYNKGFLKFIYILYSSSFAQCELASC